MQKVARKFSIAVIALFTVFTALSYMPTKAALIVPKVQYVSAPKLEYTAGDRVQFNLYAPNYGGRVQYRVVLWDNNRKEMRDLWPTGDRYYKNWQPYGNNVFTLGWPIFEPGTYRITIYAKRAGVANNKTALKGFNCDSYMESAAFTVKAKEATPVSVAALNNVSVNQFDTPVLPAQATLNMSDNTTRAAKVTWPAVDTTKVGQVTVMGVVEGTALKAAVKVNIKEAVLGIKSVAAASHDTAKLVFNVPVENVNLYNFGIDGGNNVIKAELLDDRVTVNLTFSSSLVDGASYEVTANEVRIAGTTKEVSGLKATFKYELAGIGSIALLKNTFDVGENINDFLSIKDKNGYEVSKSDYTLARIESSNTSVIDNTNGSVEAAGTANLRFTVNYYDGEVTVSPFLKVEVKTAANGLAAGYEIADTNTFENAVIASKDVPVMHASDAPSYLHVYINDSSGNPGTAPIDLSTSGPYSVTTKTPVIVGAGQDSKGALITPISPGAGTIEIKDITTGWVQTVRVEVAAAPEYSDLYVSEAGTSVKLSDAESTNPGIDYDESVNQKTIGLGWTDQNGKRGIVNAGASIDNSNPMEIVISNFVKSGDKLVISTTATAFKMSAQDAETLVIRAVQGRDITNAAVKASYFAAAEDRTATTVKALNVTVVNVDETAVPYNYAVTADNTNLSSRDDPNTPFDERKAIFTGYALDRYGNKLNKLAAEDIKVTPAVNVPASVSDWFDFADNTVTFGTAACNPALYMPKGGTIKVEYTINRASDPYGSIMLNYGDTAGIPAKAVVDTTPVLIDFNRLGTNVTSISVYDILFGTVNTRELVLDDLRDGVAASDTVLKDAIAVRVGADGYYYAPVVTFTDIAKEVVKTGVSTYGFNTAAADPVTGLINGNIFGDPLTGENDKFTVEYAITNVKNVSDTAGVFTIAGGNLGSFTLVIKSVKMAKDPRGSSEQLELLTAPAAIDVVLTDK